MTTPDHGGSRSDRPTQPDRAGLFARLPRWARVVIPLAILVVVAAIVAVVIAATAGPSGSGSPGSDDPEAVAEAACRTAAEAQLERRGESQIEVAERVAVTEQADGGYRVQGTVTFDQDGSTHHADVRCIVRIEGDAADVVSVRFND